MLTLPPAALGAAADPAGGPRPGQNYFSIQALSGDLDELSGARRSAADLPYVRVERRAGLHVLRIGYWSSRDQASKRLPQVRERFPTAFVRVAEYKPADVVEGWDAAPRDAPVAAAGTASGAAAPNVLALQQSVPSNILYYQESGGPPYPAPPAPVKGSREMAPSPASPEQRAPSETAIAAAPARRPAPDERKLWALFERGDYDTLSREIRRLGKRYPGWKPPATLVKPLRQAEFRARVEHAIAGRDHAALIGLARLDPGAFSCLRIDWAWSLAEAYAALEQGDRLASLLEWLMTRCESEQDRLATLYKSRPWIAQEAWKRLLAREETVHHSAEIEARLQQLRYEHSVAALVAANQRGEPSVAMFQRLAPQVEARRDSDTALFGGWILFADKQYSEASSWFARVLQWDPARAEAHKGLALCALAEARYDQAIEHGRAIPAADAAGAQALRDAWVGRAGLAYRAARYTDALVALGAAAEHGELPRYARLMRAWSRYHLGDTGDAADEFVALYRAEPDDESAEGALNSLLRLGREQELTALAVFGPLAEKRRRREAQQAFGEKRFLRARVLDPDAYGRMGAVAAPQASLQAAQREKTGSAGTSQLRLRVSPALELGWAPAPREEFQVRLDRVALDSGALPAGSNVGSVPVVPAPYAFAPVTETQGWQPAVHFRREGNVVWQAEVGLTPSGGPLGMRPFGSLSAQRSEAGTSYSVAVYRQPVRESILSYVGQRDPYGGGAWGRVLRNGVQAQGSISGRNGWSVGGQAKLELLTGTQVADNVHLALDFNLGRDLRLPGFDYAVLGAGVGADRYQKNLSQFTLGHGGYFSPQSFWRLGPSFDFLTTEGRAFVAKGRLAAGHVYKREEAAPFFPLAPDGRSYQGASEHGSSASAEVSAVWRVTDRVQAGVVFARNVAPQFSDLVVGGFVRILWDPRDAVLSADFPVRLTRGLY